MHHQRALYGTANCSSPAFLDQEVLFLSRGAPKGVETQVGSPILLSVICNDQWQCKPQLSQPPSLIMQQQLRPPQSDVWRSQEGKISGTAATLYLLIFDRGFRGWNKNIRRVLLSMYCTSLDKEKSFLFPDIDYSHTLNCTVYSKIQFIKNSKQ